MSFTWTDGRRMSTASAGGHTLSFEYNGDGIRTAKTADGVKHVYITGDNRLLQETWGSNKIEYLYDDTGTIFSLYYNGAKFYLIKNLQGDVVELRNSTNGLVARYTYDAYGKCTSVKDSSGAEITDASNIALINPIRYRGYYFDSETGLYYVSSRYYDPEIGRFISPDTTDVLAATPNSLTDKNLYAYCDNNPVVRVDHGGEFWHIVIGAVAGALIGGVVKAVSNAIEGKSLTDGLATAMLSGAASGALASTGVGIAGMVTGNAAISMAENATNQVIENKGFNNFDVGDMLIDGAIGGVSGALGGAGKGSKHLTNLGKQTVKRTFNATTNRGLKAGLKEAGKAFAYYGKNSAKYYKAFVKGLPSDFFTAVGTTIISSSYMKYQYRRVFRR